jgi:hypothetical protein
MKRITVCVTRLCCQFEDLVPASGAKFMRGKRAWTMMRCKHCDTLHEFYKFTDAAGSTDWNYRPIGRK